MAFFKGTKYTRGMENAAGGCIHVEGSNRVMMGVTVRRNKSASTLRNDSGQDILTYEATDDFGSN